MEIAERFDLRERFGGGAAADVHRAFDHKLDRDVVVRILRADFAADEEYVERFQREAEAATGIRHPNVVEVLDHGVVAGRPFLVRELVEGSMLDDLLERRGALPEQEARALGEQIARALEAAHARGVLHRDLNAGNVFVTPEGTAKVVDFGMPTVPRHPAPEQVSREQIDERADVYGAGAVLYQMLTGHVPRGRVVPPRRLAARVSKRIEAIALRALESEPARRYATAAEMADALGALAPAMRRVAPAVVAPVVRPMLVPPAAPSERVVRPRATLPPPRRRSSASPFILLVLPVLIALLVGAFTLARLAPTNTAVLSATTTPQPTTAPTVSPAPTSLPPVETTPEPTTQPSPVPTAEPAPPAPEPTLAPAPPPSAVVPAPAPAAVAPTAPSPAASVVRSFYELITQERFDEAAALWSPRMQANYPPSSNIYGRFDRTREFLIRDITPVPQNTGGASVAIDILEVLDSGVTRRWVGQWHLVWDGSRWLMDAPNLRAA